MSGALLVVGITGAGKSTVCNCLAQIDPEDRSRAFRESAASCSETRKFKCLQIEGWKLVDTVGLGDTAAEAGVVYRDIAEACNECAQTGISHILLVTRGRVTQDQLLAFKAIGSVLLDEHMWKYTTMIKTGFPGFMKSEKCAADIDKMKRDHPALAELLPKIEDRVVHVDNQDSDANDQWEIKRNQSRQKILDHLRKAIPAIPYMPPNLEKVRKRIEEDLQRLREKENMAKALQDQKAQIEKLEEEGKANEKDRERLRNLEKELSEAKQKSDELQENLAKKMANHVKESDDGNGFFTRVGQVVDKILPVPKCVIQ